MEKKDVYNEDVNNDSRMNQSAEQEGADQASRANVADGESEATDTMAEDAEPELAESSESDKKEKKHDKGAAHAEVAEWKDKLMRLHAEFDNYRKRTLKEKMDLVQSGGRDVLLTMLPVRDDVQRAVEAMQKSDDIEALRAGVMLISQKFTDSLRQKGVTEIDIKGKEFDADLCEAVAKVDAGEEMKGKVVDIVQTGYMLGEKVLRFAKVVVGD